MNAFGEFLYELRKEKGMTQSALAERLGVTNKAVSKWETGEAMPETGLLLPISEIFGVTVDELLNGRRAGGENRAPCGSSAEQDPAEKASEMEQDGSFSEKTTVGENLFTRGKDDEETFADKLCGVICAAVVLCGIAVYLFLGGFAGLWHPYWVVVPVCALSCGIIGIFFHMFDGDKRCKEQEEGKNPYTGGVCGILVLAGIITYLLCGALGNLWHPFWLVIVAAVALGSLIAAIGNCFTFRRKRR